MENMYVLTHHMMFNPAATGCFLLNILLMLWDILILLVWQRCGC